MLTNVRNYDVIGPALDNSISLALTVVFVLPALQVQGRGNTGTSFVDYIFDNNVIIFFLFLGTYVAYEYVSVKYNPQCIF